MAFCVVFFCARDFSAMMVGVCEFLFIERIIVTFFLCIKFFENKLNNKCPGLNIKHTTYTQHLLFIVVLFFLQLQLLWMVVFFCLFLECDRVKNCRFLDYCYILFWFIYLKMKCLIFCLFNIRIMNIKNYFCQWMEFVFLHLKMKLDFYIFFLVKV